MSASAAWAPSAASSVTSSARRQAPTASADRSSPSPPASRWPGHDRAVSEKPGREASSSLRYDINPDFTEVHQMFNALLISSLYVLDQDKALDFYVGKL